MTDSQRSPEQPVIDRLQLHTPFRLARVELGLAVQCYELGAMWVPLADPGGCRRSEALGLVDDVDVDEAAAARHLAGYVP